MLNPEPFRRLAALTAAAGAAVWMTGLTAAADAMSLRWSRDLMRRRAERTARDDEPAMFI